MVSAYNFWDGALVRLRAIEPEDVAHFLRWNEDSERGRMLDFLWPPQSAESVRRWVDEQVRRRGENDEYQWIIERSDRRQAVGSLATHHCSRRDGVSSYALDIETTQRRQGFAAAAVQMVLRYYFGELRYQKCSICVHGDNPASLALHQALGFHPEGVQRRMLYTNGGYVDLHWWGLTVEEWAKLV
jgi:RimJ/RimL family protein N-acetyltransferase